MTRKVAFLLIFCLVASSAHADAYISFSPGPDFTTRVNTPWGSYIVDAEPDGGAAWVGTEEEYTTRKALGSAGPGGLREMHVEGQGPHDHYLVSNRLPAVHLGQTTLAQIMGSVLLNQQNSGPIGPHKREGYQYVMLNWVPNRKATINVVLRDLKTAEVFKPYWCNPEQCEYQIPKAELTVPMTAIFTIPKAPPAAIAIKSMAYFDYEANKATLVRGEKVDPETLKALHAIDPHVPLPGDEINPANMLKEDVVERINATLARIEKVTPTWDSTADEEMRLWNDKPEYQALLSASYTKRMRLIAGPMAAYPSAMSGVKARVLVSFVVGTDGSVEAARILESSDPRFNGPALDAVIKYKFSAAEGYNGETREIAVLPLNFVP